MKHPQTGTFTLSPVLPTEDQARAWRQEHEAAFEASGPAAEDGARLATVVQDFLAAAEDAYALDPYGRPYSPAALNELQWVLAGHVANALGGMPVRAVRRRQLQALLEDLQRDGLSPDRLHTVVDALSAFYDYAIDRRLIETNPVDTLPIPAVTQGAMPAVEPSRNGWHPPADAESSATPGVSLGANGVIPNQVFMWGLHGLVILFVLIALVLVAESV